MSLAFNICCMFRNGPNTVLLRSTKRQLSEARQEKMKTWERDQHPTDLAEVANQLAKEKMQVVTPMMAAPTKWFESP